MSNFWIICILMAVSLGAGLLVGTSWNIHALDYRYRRLAAERRELDETRRALHDGTRHQRTASSPTSREPHRRAESRRGAATRSEGTGQDSVTYAGAL